MIRVAKPSALALFAPGAAANGGLQVPSNQVTPGGRGDLSTETAVHGRAGYLRRTGDFANYIDANNVARTLDGNFAGPALDITFLWRPSVLTDVSFHAERITGDTGDSSCLSGVSHAYRITPAYHPTVKLDVSAFIEYAQRSYFSNVLQAIALTPQQAALLGVESGAMRVDHTRSVGVSAKWSPRRWLTANLAMRHDSRDSTVQLFQYTDTFASVGVAAGF